MPQSSDSTYTIALVGASSLKGKEIKEVLEERHLPMKRLILLDAPDLGGQLTEFEDEPVIVEPISKSSFEGVSLAIFATSSTFTRDHWQMAESSGCEILDLSYFLDSNPKAVLRAPIIKSLWRNEADGSAESRISVAAHPMAAAIAGILARVSTCSAVERSVMTVYQPVSEHGKAGVDELHQQTVSLLSFQKLPHTEFNSQVAFNLLSSYGMETKPTLREDQERISHHLAELLGGHLIQPALRVLHAPIFFGYAFSCFVELKETVPPEALEEALDSKPLVLCRDAELQPSVVGVAGSDEVILGRIERDASAPAGYWIWGALDNLRFAALNTVEIAEGLLQACLGQNRAGTDDAA